MASLRWVQTKGKASSQSLKELIIICSSSPEGELVSLGWIFKRCKSASNRCSAGIEFLRKSLIMLRFTGTLLVILAC